MRDPTITGYMGAADRQLFYCFDAPRRARARPFGFVLCPPSGREYVSTHRVFRQFASRLARAGFPVLRFDYFATGDSAGEDSEGSVEQWLDDVATAVNTFRNHNPGAPVWLAGLRVGASLAALHAEQHQDVDGLILWDPVVNGNRYVDQLLEAHQQRFRQTVGRDQTTSDADGMREIFGFLLSPRLESGLRAIDLATLPRAPAPQVLLMSSSPQADPDDLGNRLAALGASVDRKHVLWPELWAEGAEMNDVLMPPARVLQAMVESVQGGRR
ncbi:MAG: alpha/beta fold hydrolase [Candidatus Accumulibacter phosphatis]|jgi:alpha/beta superfamily hydrolase|nr:alpha/beta fold hydrolase [Candidatus Accumulibacter contiguus]